MTLHHPPDTCCTPRTLWTVVWIADRLHRPSHESGDLAPELPRLVGRLMTLLTEHPEPQSALALAHRRVLEWHPALGSGIDVVVLEIAARLEALQPDRTRQQDKVSAFSSADPANDSSRTGRHER